MPIPYAPTKRSVAPPARRAPLRPPLVRSGRSWTPGVSAAVARQLGEPAWAVRLAFVVLTFFGFAGLVAYCFLWVFVPRAGSSRARALEEKYLVAGGLGGVPAEPTAAEAERNRFGGVAIIGFGVLALAVLAANPVGFVGSTPVWVLVPLLAMAIGVAIAWSQIDVDERDRWVGGDGSTWRNRWLRVGLGALLMTSGILVLTTRGASLIELRDAALAALTVLLGAAALAAPWIIRLWRDVHREQVATALATERADIAAHLHDSVLQTLALIQRRSDDPVMVAQLARAQQRELRAWLYDGPAAGGTSLAAELTRVADEVDEMHGIPVELVSTGDADLDQRGTALAAAVREALINAALHASPPITAYAEIGADSASVFIRDRGEGFDVEDIPADRLGVRESIVGRVERLGGSAAVRRRDDGTEVELRMPLLATKAATTAKDAS